MVVRDFSFPLIFSNFFYKNRQKRLRAPDEVKAVEDEFSKWWGAASSSSSGKVTGARGKKPKQQGKLGDKHAFLEDDSPDDKDKNKDKDKDKDKDNEEETEEKTPSSRLEKMTKAYQCEKQK